MSRTARLNRTIRRAVERRLEKIEPKKRGSLRLIAKTLGFLTGILSIAVALLSLLPRINVTVSDPPDLENAFSALVTVTNTGFIPLRSVGVDMGVGEVCTQHAPCAAREFPDPTRTYSSRLHREQLPDHDLKIDDHFTIALDDISRVADEGGLVYADIAVIIHYRLPIIYLSQEKVFPLYTRKASNGKLYWQWK